MRGFVAFALNVVLGGLAGAGMADAASAHMLTQLAYGCSGLIGGALAGAASWR